MCVREKERKRWGRGSKRWGVGLRRLDERGIQIYKWMTMAIEVLRGGLLPGGRLILLGGGGCDRGGQTFKIK